MKVQGINNEGKLVIRDESELAISSGNANLCYSVQGQGSIDNSETTDPQSLLNGISGQVYHGSQTISLASAISMLNGGGKISVSIPIYYGLIATDAFIAATVTINGSTTTVFSFTIAGAGGASSGSAILTFDLMLSGETGAPYVCYNSNVIFSDPALTPTPNSGYAGLVALVDGLLVDVTCSFSAVADPDVSQIYVVNQTISYTKQAVAV